MPQVLNKRYNRSDNAVYIGRPGPFGNPFQIGRDGTREEVVQKYTRWLFSKPQTELRKRMVRELTGKDLMCWCSPELCHGHVILEMLEHNAK